MDRWMALGECAGLSMPDLSGQPLCLCEAVGRSSLPVDCFDFDKLSLAMTLLTPRVRPRALCEPAAGSEGWGCW